MAETGKPPVYYAYLLRLWRDDACPTCWRASLEDPQTGKRVGFASLEKLLAYLRERTSTPSPGDLAS
ncbi:MAG: hypothetical protein GXO56_07970 [Chloroflexi bacterium]|nr:hypothetical protein [Chloroflexota bacterium]